MTPQDILRPSEDAIARKVGGELVIMHLATGTYFGLNAVGARVWQLLEEAPCSLATLCHAIAEEFDAPADVIEADVTELASALARHDLITCAA